MKAMVVLHFMMLTTALALAEDNTQKPVWEPSLPNGQRFIALLRSIKSYRIALYDIYHRGERYPVTELNCELTHGSVRFLAIEASAGKMRPLTLSEIAEGKHLEKDPSNILPGREPSAELKHRTVASTNQVRFLMGSPDDVQRLYQQLNTAFRIGFPW